MTLQNDLTRINEKMEQLKQHPKKDQLFGAGLDNSLFGFPPNSKVKTGHEYQLNETISLDEVEKLEKKWKITLPEDYKLFITEIGNGGMGPYYGLLPFESNPDKQKNYLKDTICLVHEGCGYFQHLGVKGSKKGKLYADLEAADGGIHQLKVSSFFDWYELWLDHSLKTLDALLTK